MSRLTALFLAVAILCLGAGVGFLAGRNAQMPSAEISTIESVEMTSEVVAVGETEIIDEIATVTEATGGANNDEGFIEGLFNALDLVNAAKISPLNDQSSVLMSLASDHQAVLTAQGLDIVGLKDAINAAAEPSEEQNSLLSGLRREVATLDSALTEAQAIAQIAIDQRNSVDLALAESQRVNAALEARIANDRETQTLTAERTRLIAALALEQPRVDILRDTLRATDAGIAQSVESEIDQLSENDLRVTTLASDIDRLTQRYNQSIERLEKARQDLRLVQTDTNNTLNTLETRTSQLLTLEGDLEAAKSELLDVEAKRLSMATELAQLEISLQARRGALGLSGADESGSISGSEMTNTVELTASDTDQSGNQLIAQTAALARKIADLESRLLPLQNDFESQVQSQATLQAAVIAEEMAQQIAQEIASDRARVLADEMAQDLAAQLENERAKIVSAVLAAEGLDQMSIEEIANLAGLRVVSDDAALDTISPIRRYLYDKLLEASAENDEASPRLVGERLLLSTNTLFPSAGILLSPAGQKELRAFGGDLLQILSEADGQARGPQFFVQVNGHADKRPYRTNRFGNWELSALRAVSVVEFLIEEVGLPADRLIAAGFAENQPLIDGDTDSDYALNRRIEFRLVAQ